MFLTVYLRSDWKNHGSEYYECSRYKENPNIANESANVKAREALKKYLFYYERVRCLGKDCCAGDAWGRGAQSPEFHGVSEQEVTSS